MPPTPYPELNTVLEELVKRTKAILGNNFVGMYLQGSFALGDFDEHSDVDYIAVIKDELTPEQVNALQIMHDEVYQLDSEWAKHLEGSYFPKEILRDPTKEGLDLWYLDHGARSLILSDHCNTNLVRWIVRERGVSLAGPPPKTLVDPISEDLTKQHVYETIHHWGQEILENPEKFNNRFYQGFIVLNYCRMLHDLYRGYPGTKMEGAEWAKSVLDPSWIELIDATWDNRPDPAWQVRQPADPVAYERTLAFVRHVMALSEQYINI